MLVRSLPLVERLKSQVTSGVDASWEARLEYWGRGRSHQPRANSNCVDDRGSSGGAPKVDIRECVCECMYFVYVYIYSECMNVVCACVMYVYICVCVCVFVFICVCV